MSDEDVLLGQNAFDLYKQKRETWNAWAEQHEGWIVDFSNWDFGEERGVDFRGFLFPGAVSFNRTKFGKGAVTFEEATFGEGDVSFSGCQYSGPVYFDGADLGEKSAEVDFTTTVFESSISLDNATFHCVPDFRHTRIERDISMEGMTVEYKCEPNHIFFRKAQSPNDASKYRKLKKLATEAKDHERELEFFSYELRAKYAHSISSLQYLPILLYGLFSDFGRSLGRPILGLLITWLLATEIFFSCSWEHLDGTRADALWLSAGNLLSFIYWGRAFRQEYMEELYGDPPKIDWIVNAVAYTEGLLSLVFLLLIGLAFRNKLRI